MFDETDQLLLARVLSHYSARYHPTETVPISQAGFSGARIWKVSTPAGSFALRQWPAAGLEPARLIGLHRLLQHINEQNVAHVACPVPAMSGSTLVSHAGRLWQLEPWLTGVADYHIAPSAAKLSAALQALAGWHRAAATFVPREEHRQWFASHPSAPSPGITERRRLILDWNRPRLATATEAVRQVPVHEFRDVALPLLSAFQTSAPQISDELRMARDIRFPLQPCLRDVWHDHLLFVGDQVTGIIDPAACRGETVAGDIARLVGSLVGDDRGDWETAVAAYQTIRPLSIDERAAIALFDRSGVLLSGMTWIQRIAVNRQPTADMTRVVERLRTISQRLQNLV